MDKIAAPCLPAKATAHRTLHPGHCDLHVGLSERPQIDHGSFELKPNAHVGDISSIWGYALTVDGYRYAKTNLGVECGDLANQKLGIFERSGIWQGSFEELRCCLFFEQRRWLHFGTDPTGDQLMGLQALFLAVSENWDIEAGDPGV